MMKRSYENMGRAVREIRERAGWPQSRLASKLGISAQQLSNAERGLAGLKIQRLKKLIRTLPAAKPLKVIETAIYADALSDAAMRYEEIVKN